MEILESSFCAHQDGLEYLWFRLQTEQGERFRCVALRELAALPVDSAEDYNLLGKQWGAVRGLYNAGVNFAYTACGIYTPEHIGVVQFYGAVAEGGTLAEAAGLALNQLAAVLAVLANFTQSQTRRADLRWVQWYVDFIQRRGENVLAILGYPDPRQSGRGLGMDGKLPDDSGDDLSSEQNEMLFRGLAKLRQDFVFQVTARHVGRRFLTDTLMRLAEITSNVASRRKGAMSVGFSLGVPLMAALSNSVGGGHSAATSQAHSTADGQSHGWGQAHTDSSSHTESRSSSVGGSETHTVGSSHTDSQSHTDSRGHTDSQSHSDTWSQTSSHSHTDSSMSGGSSSHSESSGHTDSSSSGSSSSETSGSSLGVGVSSSDSSGSSTNASTSTGTSASATAGHTDGWSAGASVGGGVPGVASASVSTGVSGSDSASATTGSSSSETSGSGTSQGHSDGVSVSAGMSEASTTGTSSATGSADMTASSDTTTTMWSSGSSDTYGSASSVGGADTTGSADSVGSADSHGSADGVSESDSVSRSWSQSWGQADSQGQADSRGENWGRSHAEGDAVGQAVGRSGMQAVSGGFSTGMVPGVSLNRSWQLEDDVAERLTEVLRQIQGLVNVASQEGGFMTDALLFTATSQGAIAAEALVPQAFHGPNVPTPVLTVRPDDTNEERQLRRHALAFLPYDAPDPHDPFHGLLWGRYATLLTASQVAAYTAPGLFPEGTTVTAMPPIPKGMGFYPTMPGEAVLGHQYSPETADLTTAPIRLDQGRLMHCLFAGDTGFGKSVAAIRWAYETTLCWRLRTVVLDFGAGWRQLLNAPGLEGRVDILQLWPNAARPLRWNPLQIGRNIDPETQWRAFADIFGSVAKLGVKRQKQELLEALRKLYVRNGVLVDDPEVRGDLQWGRVQGDESGLLSAPAGAALSDLSARQRQQAAVYRSHRIGLADLHKEIAEKLSHVAARDTMLTGVLEGILFRLNPLVQGAAAAQFAAGPGTLAIEDLGKPWGIAIVEGGMFLDDFGKAFLLGWIGWHLYTDMVARRVHEVRTDEPLLQIFFEEANKIFTKDSGGSGEDDSGGVSASQRFGDMFRDARKYRARLHVITQAPHLIPDDIVSSCNNLVVGFLKNPKDKDLVLSALARSEKGFHDEPWRRFVSDQPIGMVIGRLPYTDRRELQRPFLFRPLLVDAPEPTDDEIEKKLGKIL